MDVDLWTASSAFAFFLTFPDTNSLALRYSRPRMDRHISLTSEQLAARKPATAKPMTILRLAALLSALTMTLATAQASPAPDLTVALPAGETRLEEIGLYRVGWQSYGKGPVAMPLSWRGHFDPQTGISYLPWGRVLDRPALLFHSPWHVPPGKTWVDYRLRLPSLTPIRLSFGIAMGPDVAVPGKSDGVTFSCVLLTEGAHPATLNAQPLLDRLHYDQGQWRDFSFDFSVHDYAV